MAKRAKKKNKKKAPVSIAGAQGPGQVGLAGKIAGDTGSFGGTGIRSRVIQAKSKVTELVNKGVRLSKTGPTSAHYKKAVKKSDSAQGRLGKLFR